METEINLFNERIKPDYYIMRRQDSKQDPKPLYIIEAKRTDKKSTLLSELDQHVKQLRYICINNQLPHVNGVITDFRDWYFTRYSLDNELLEENPIIELSEKYRVLTKEKQIDKEKLAFVVHIFEWLCGQ